MRAAVVPDYLAVAIVAAIVAGAGNNPRRASRLLDDLARTGWSPDIALTKEEFRLAASSEGLVEVEEADLVDSAVEVALLLSDFVLDQLIITRPIGEMRPAVERSVRSGDDADDVWLYDPSERDRSTRVHRSLENWLMAQLRGEGIEPFDPAGEPFFDLAWRTPTAFFVCEVKSTSNVQAHQLRLGLGQILQYRHLLQVATPESSIRGALLVEDAPEDGRWIDICARSGIVLFWPSRWEDVRAELAGWTVR
jgi:hypothetical protein